ncbi:Crp/Fnr family transcriptional regulator [Bacillus sp. S13(2024)]|uniref:Crp/Fnr family transcriptional regulator n=1 Tax=unclassified Bacillus (in: firmicutes) TaxID=185979 RepID=UPI003D263400
MQKMVENFIQDKMPDEVIKKIECMFKSKKISKGEIVVHVGDIQNELYFILSGLLRSYYIDINGNDVTHFFPRKGTLCVGEALFNKGPSKHCVEAIEDCEVLVVHVNDFKKLVEEDIYCMKVYMKVLEYGFKYKIERESSFLLKSATERYLDFKRMHPELEERVNQAYIASYLGITPVSLSRIKRAIREHV